MFRHLRRVAAAVWAATEWTAWRLGFQAELGAPWYMLGHWPVYAPLKLFFWWYWCDVYAPHVFEQGGAIAVSPFDDVGPADAVDVGHVGAPAHTRKQGRQIGKTLAAMSIT